MSKGHWNYIAVFDNQDGSFDYICEGGNEKEVRERACKQYDNERVRVQEVYIEA